MNTISSRRKVANHPDWKRVKAARFAVLSLEEDYFSGRVSLFYIDSAVDPLEVQYDGHLLRILDDGYSWLRHFPVGTQYIVTTMFAPDGQILQWFIDLCLSHGTTTEGIPWWDDLYLDVAILPSGQIFVLDADELDEALDKGIISAKDHSSMWQEAQRLIDLIREERLDVLGFSARHRQQLMPLLR